ncbi:MAG: ParB-like protein [Bdellovibrionota bacterium]
MHTFKAPLRDLRPTQEHVGFLEVREKVKKIERLSAAKRRLELRQHAIPVVICPDGKLYIVDHHHLARALWDADYRHAWVKVVKDFSRGKRKKFWSVLEEAGDVYLRNKHGKRINPSRLPKKISRLRDDPYRSLAGFVRRKGGFHKSPTPYSEFLWAQFFRNRIGFTNSEKGLRKILPEALRLARTARAKKLPGFIGR